MIRVFYFIWNVYARIICAFYSAYAYGSYHGADHPGWLDSCREGVQLLN